MVAAGKKNIPHDPSPFEPLEAPRKGSGFWPKTVAGFLVLSAVGATLGYCLGQFEERLARLEKRITRLEALMKKAGQTNNPVSFSSSSDSLWQLGSRPVVDVWDRAVKLIHWRESRYGQDPRCRRGVVGPAGERGEFQVTPIWAEDVMRLTGETVDPYDVAQCRRLVRAWLEYYAPRVGASTPEQMAELYRRGPAGYRRWAERK